MEPKVNTIRKNAVSLKITEILTRLFSPETAWKLLIQTISVIAALLLGAVIIKLMGFNPISAYRAMFLGSLGSLKAVWETLVKATPLILTGLSFAYAARADQGQQA